MNVKVISKTENPIKVLWTATRTCKVEEPPQDLFTSEVPEEKMLEVLRRVWQAGHLSIFEHVNLTYAVDGISRVCLAEFTRHRTGITYSVKGQRMKLNSVGFLEALSNSTNGVLQEAYRDAINYAIKCYRKLVANGVPAENARYVLPQATLCNLVCTVNLRELKHLWDERGNNLNAHWEIRYLVRDMVKEAVTALPWLAEVNQEWASP